MSFAVRLCANLLRRTWGTVTAEPMAFRNFHMLTQARESAPALGGLVGAVKSPGASTVNGTAPLLTPTNSMITQVAGFKVKGKLKPRCKDCYYVIRQQRHYIICPTHPRHKQMSMKKRDYKSWILTHATQSKVRPY